jgi:hypothetical protein
MGVCCPRQVPHWYSGTKASSHAVCTQCAIYGTKFDASSVFQGLLSLYLVFLVRCFGKGILIPVYVFGRFDLAALAQPHLKFLFVYLWRLAGRLPSRLLQNIKGALL